MISKKKQENREYVYSVLIADHSHSERGFASFGGRIKEHEDPRDTAVRESYEESRNQFTQEELLRQITSAQPIRTGEFTVFVILVRQIPEIELETASADCRDCGERKAYAWIPVFELDRIINKKGRKIPGGLIPVNATTNYIWTPFVHTYKAASPIIRKIISNDIKKTKGK